MTVLQTRCQVDLESRLRLSSEQPSLKRSPSKQTGKTLPANRRRGSVMGLMAFLLPVLALLAALCVNLAHMQLTRTELVVATDAAARAGGRAFSQLQTTDAAKDAAVATALMNTVDGSPLQLRPEDSYNEIEFGATSQPGGEGTRYHFTKVPTATVNSTGGTIASAVRVNGERSTGSLGGRVPFVFPNMFSSHDFEPTQQSVAMQVDRDISLVIDRSGSMNSEDWPEGFSVYSYDNLVAGSEVTPQVSRYNSSSGYWELPQGSAAYKKWLWEDHLGNTYPLNRWDALKAAVDAFFQVLQSTPQQEQAALASYSTYGSRDTWLDKDFTKVTNKLNSLGPSGWTGIGRGMEQGIKHFTDSNALNVRPFASRTMVVMTDGNHNRGTDPETIAANFATQYENLTIHTVTFGVGANKAHMKRVAEACRGTHWHAEDSAQLVQVFQEIANNLPTLLTQ
ncbi:MAG: vWA domain-containing protein [Planctomycetota bacterium]